jgi:hypothetical protein
MCYELTLSINRSDIYYLEETNASWQIHSLVESSERSLLQANLDFVINAFHWLAYIARQTR